MSVATAEAPPPPVYIFREHKSTVNFVQLFGRDQFIASCDADGWIIIWKMRTRRPLLKQKAHESSCLKVAVTALTQEKYTLISQGRDNMIHIWEVCLQEQAHIQLGSSIVYNALGFCKFSCYDKDKQDSTLLCFPSKDDITFFDVYDLTYQRFVHQNIGYSRQQDSGSPRFGSCMAVELFKTFDQHTIFVLAGYESGSVVLWQIKQDQFKLIWKKQEHQEPILDLSIDHLNSVAISSAADNQICKYSLTTGDIIKKITIKKSGVAAVSIRSDNKIFASGGHDGRIRVFSLKSMKPLAVLSYHKDTTYCIDFGTDSNWLIASSQDNRISLWNIF